MLRPTALSALAALGLLLSLTGGAAAQLLDSPRAQGMGGAVRGDPVADSALLYNPAGMSRAMIYQANVAYLRGSAAEQNAVSVSVVDSKTQPTLAMGVAYAYHFSDGGAPQDVSGHDVRLGFSSPIVPQKLSIGTTLRYAHFDREGGDDFKAFTLDAGLLFSPVPTVHLGLVAQNLVPTDDVAAPRRVGGGVGVTAGVVAFDVDVLADLDTAEETKPVVNGGMEVLLGERVPLRAGYVYEGPTERQLVAFGIGFVENGQVGGMQLNLGARVDLDDASRYDISFGVAAFL